MVQRAKTTLGLLAQLIKVRWGRLGKRGKILLFAVLVLGSLTALQLGACMFGACPGSNSPCSLDQEPCHGAQMDEDAPCPYSGQSAAQYEAPAAETADDDVPPCHRQ